MTTSSRHRHRRAAPTAAQRGVVMIITLIALVVLMAGGVALVRSADASASLAGQLAFRRDLKNQGERGIARATALLQSGALATVTSRHADLATANYSADRLASTAQGLPAVLLLGSDAFAAAGLTAADLSDTTTGVTVRTVIDRLCLSTGAATEAGCTMLPLDCYGKGGHDTPTMGADVLKCMGTAYRISVRVDGPRATQAFFQTVVAR